MDCVDKVLQKHVWVHLTPHAGVAECGCITGACTCGRSQAVMHAQPLLLGRIWSHVRPPQAMAFTPVNQTLPSNSFSQSR